MLARVLLVEDDASIRRFVSLALEDLPLELVECASLQDGRTALAAGGADLLVTDLMLPDGNGIELLEAVGAQAGPRPRCIVFSAGISATLRQRLEALGAWRIVDKPASIAALLEAVGSALGAADPVAQSGSALPADDVVQRHFGGDAGLYRAFRAQAVAQFAADLAEGERCVAATDLPALRRLAHSVKSVLVLLGDDAGGERARELERLAAAGAADAATHWPALREHLAGWARR